MRGRGSRGENFKETLCLTAYIPSYSLACFIFYGYTVPVSTHLLQSCAMSAICYFLHLSPFPSLPATTTKYRSPSLAVSLYLAASQTPNVLNRHPLHYDPQTNISSSFLSNTISKAPLSNLSVSASYLSLRC